MSYRKPCTRCREWMYPHLLKRGLCPSCQREPDLGEKKKRRRKRGRRSTAR